MKNKFLHFIIMGSKWTLYGTALQCIVLNLLFASVAEGQKYVSIRDAKVSINISNTNVIDVFNLIESQTDYRFSYHLYDIKEDVRISASRRNIKVADLLMLIAKETRLNFKQINNTIHVQKREQQQDPIEIEITYQSINVSGRVVSQDGDEPLPGVNVIIKGTREGTVTNIDGFYNINAPQNSVLVFSSVGYVTEEIAVNNRSSINVTLVPDIMALSEVVVIGYGTVRKSDLTGSVASISAEDIQRVPITSIDHGLQGRAPGVQVTQASAAPGGAVTVRIRGGNSLRSGNEPLYVVDGFPIYNDNNASNAPTGGAGYPQAASPNALSFLNPNDIASIEILKDASATAIYGARGANGVVLITTKRGKEGQSHINYDAYYGVQQVSKKIDLLDGKTFAEVHNQGRLNDGRTILFDGSFYPLPEEIGKGTDWQDEAFQSAPIQNHQLSFSGGTSKTLYALSFNYFDQEGIVIGSNFKRGTIRSNIDITPIEKVKIGSSLTYSYSSSDFAQSESMNTGQRQGTIGAILFNSPTLPVYTELGEYYTFQHLPQDPNIRMQDNPIALAREAKDRGETSRFLGNMYAQYQIIDGLDVKISLGADLLNNRRNQYFPRVTRVGFLENSYASQGTRAVSSWLNENIITYRKTFGRIHDINLVGGFTRQEQINMRNLMENKNFINDNLQENNMGAGTLPGIPSSDKSKWQMSSWLGRINYTLNNKYLFTLSGRSDGSSRFGAGNKWAFFPSAAFAWRMSDENFMKEVKVLSDLKFRLSYGITGNNEIPVYRSLARLGIFNYNINGVLVSGLAPSVIANPNLKWETTEMTNFGIDLGFFEDRLTLTANYYYNLTKDLLDSKTIPVTTGFTTTFTNTGSLENRGFEVGISSDILTGNFKWNTQVNWSMNRNKILDIGDSEPYNASNVGSGFSVGGSRVEVGLPVGSFWGHVSNGLYNSAEVIAEDPWADISMLGSYRFKDLNNDGLFNTQDQTVIGDPNADFIWAWNNNLSFKNFDLSVFFNGVQGADLFNPHFSFLGSGRPTTSNLLRFTVEDAWSPENPNGKNGRLNAGNNNGAFFISDRYVFDGSFIRLRNISLGYTLPLKSRNIRTAKVYISGQNLLTISDYWGFDPEVNSQGQNNFNQGIDTNAYPTAKSLMLGINLGL